MPRRPLYSTHAPRSRLSNIIRRKGENVTVGVTFRSVIIGLILIPVNTWWLASMEIIWLSGQPSTLSLQYNVIWILVWVILANLLVKRFRPAHALQGAEILVVYVMLSLSTALNSIDMRDVLLPMMASPHYYNAGDGQFVEATPHVPEWLLVTDQNALRAYHLGQESFFDPANYGPWLRPLGRWTVFILALCAVMWGLNLVFRKQWTSHEKLAYPVLQLPMQLALDPSALLRSRSFWAAFAVAGFLCAMNGINKLYPLMPSIPLVHIINLQTLFTSRPWVDMGGAPVSFYPFAIAMCFFMPLDLAFSCWFFFLFWKMQRVMASHIGIQGMPGFPFVEEQTAGGYYALALLAIWISRGHLMRFGRVMLGRDDPGADPWDRQEARIAATLIGLGLIVLVWFCLAAGMSLGVTIVFFVLYYFLSIGITRMRAELGHPSHDLHFAGPNLHIVKFLGAADMRRESPANLAMLGIFGFFNRAYRGHPMPHGLEGLRIAERLGMSYRRLLLAMGIAIVAAVVVGYVGYLGPMYRYGAGQISGTADGMGREAWLQINSRFVAPEPHQYAPTYAIGVGLLFSLGLAALRIGLPWWPFHPVGFAVSGSWSMEQLWMSFFTAWLIKAILLRYGGARAYHRAIPIMFGLMLGDFMVGGFWNIYGILREVDVYHFWPY